MADTQANPFLDMFRHLGESLHLPKVDVDSVLESHRKNLEALEQSARIAASGTMDLFNRQREAVEQGMREAAEMAGNLKPSGNPQEFVGRQADWARRSLEAAVSNAGEMAEIVRRSGTESVDVLRKRVRESMEEAMSGFKGKE
ncbi:MAG: phasin family protein [Mesorhizobium amorphae]|nr:MAG: phasin family protein [Mesorhizobium amorphae]